MSRRASRAPPPPLRLNESREAAREKLTARIAKGRELLRRQVNSQEEAIAFNKDYQKWHDYNETLLDTLFTNNSFLTNYRWSVASRVIDHEESVFEEFEAWRNALDSRCTFLESVLEQLEIIPAPQGPAADQNPSRSPTKLTRVFLVHGHDLAARESVARFIEQLDLQIVVLHEQPSGGRTIIEKLEHHADVGFALVLLTPDDLGRAVADTDLHPRARQNVILELGFFVGRLGRNCVCALHKGPLELPNDILGVVFIELDSAGGWRLALAKELRQAGVPVDLNRVI